MGPIQIIQSRHLFCYNTKTRIHNRIFLWPSHQHQIQIYYSTRMIYYLIIMMVISDTYNNKWVLYASNSQLCITCIQPMSRSSHLLATQFSGCSSLYIWTYTSIRDAISTTQQFYSLAASIVTRESVIAPKIHVFTSIFGPHGGMQRFSLKKRNSKPNSAFGFTEENVRKSYIWPTVLQGFLAIIDTNSYWTNFKECECMLWLYAY